MQVVKDPIGSKGARLTTQLSIPSRYLVLLPQARWSACRRASRTKPSARA